jgi:Caspase domain
MDAGRRNALRAAIGTAALFAPLPYAWVWAQDSKEGALKLLKAPKVALVVGNGKYKDAPELKNAPNDAKAIADTLKGAGFAVTMLLETGREALIQAIRDYVNGMEKQKAVGLFYFAGHGVQLEWRNYMLPIDAVIDKIEDVAKQSVDVARLMEGLTKAANPMNVIILDACRENPFGESKKVAQKGLSQMDAPVQTLLAYATSPGNVASDGDGANGLYTENLLREMKVPEAKIEDVFKRVRLAVRRTSKGAQIPWESTSLEDDFWFHPPKELKKLSEDEKEKAYREEASLWARAEKAGEPGPVEDYLRRYPNGNFSELAQLRLEQLLSKQGEKKLIVASQEGNPYTKGSATANTNYKVADTYAYRVLDLYSKAERSTFNQTVTQITESEVIYDNGVVTDLLGNVRRTRDGRYFSASQFLPLEFAVGKRWRTRYTAGRAPGEGFATEMEVHVAAKERVVVPAGTFDAFRLEGSGHGRTPKGALEIQFTAWFAPDRCRRPVAREELRKTMFATVAAERQELLSFKEG